MKDKFSRRDFLFIGGATAAGITLGQAGRRLLARGDARMQSPKGAHAEKWTCSVCRECPAACGVRVRSVDGVPVKLEGNPACPVARGRLCAKGQAALEGHFDPDRLTGPVRRTGKRGSQAWQPISWDAAIALVASHLRSPSAGGGQAVAFAAEEQGPIAEGWKRFWEAAGASVASTRAATSPRLRAAFTAATGCDRDPIFDIGNASYVLSLGACIAEDWLSPVWTQRTYGEFRRKPSGGRGRLVQIEAHRSMTARKADEWIAVRPEQQVTLAYGVISVVLREDRANRDFLQSFGGIAEQFEKQVIERFAPDYVAAATGVPVVTLLRLARELTASSRPLAVCPTDAAPSLAAATMALNALVGAFDREGGVFASPCAAVPDTVDAVAVLGQMAAGALQPRVVALRDASVLRALSRPSGWQKAFEKASLVVGFSPYLDETAEVADLLLPSPAPLESWQAVAPAPAIRAEAFALAAPAAAALVNARDTMSVLSQVAAKAGGPLRSACDWVSSEDLVKRETSRLFTARRGGPYSNVHQTAWLGELERGGWWVAAAPSHDAFESQVLEAGGWADPYFESGSVRAALKTCGCINWPAVPNASRQDQADARTRQSGPFHLIAFTPPVVGLVGGMNYPALFEVLGQPEGQPWRIWAEVAPDIAEQLRISRSPESRPEIRIASGGGATLDAPVIVVDGMAPGTVAVAFVPACPQGGRWSRIVRTDVRALLGQQGSGECRVSVSAL